jgi:nitrogen fixation NifU-like protein
MMNVDIESRDEIRDLYRELILDHAKKPRHFGKLDGATHTAQGINPLCGDKLHLYLRMDDHGMISDAKFEGTGCAISVASASLLTDSVIGLGKNDALQKIEQVTSRLSGSMTAADSTVELGKLRALEGVRDYPSRIKCATLAWHALNSAINKNDSPASTE